MKHVEISYKGYDNYIKMLEKKQCYVIEKGKCFSVHIFRDFQFNYKVTLVNIQDEDDYEYWYTDDLLSMAIENYLNIFVEEENE